MRVAVVDVRAMDVRVLPLIVPVLVHVASRLRGLMDVIVVRIVVPMPVRVRHGRVRMLAAACAASHAR